VLSDLGTDYHIVSSATPVIVPAFAYAVVGIGNSSNNGGAAIDYQYASFLLGNGGDEIIVTAYGQELDRLVYTSNFDVIGKSKELSVNHQTYLLNDTLTNWCPAVVTYGSGDFGTPGTVNSCSL
jgi:hypothetical protein